MASTVQNGSEMKAKSIGQLAKIAGVSVRTLRHYDDVGLLRPSHRSGNGYRMYSNSDCQRLHDILFYRALGFSLLEIQQLLDESDANRRQKLQGQRRLLLEHIDRLKDMQIQLEAALLEQDELQNAHSENELERKEMKTGSNFDVFNGFDPDKYAQEAEERWGDTDAYRVSTQRTRSYTEEDWKRYRQEWDQLNQDMVDVMNEGSQADSEQARAIANKMRLMIDQWFYPCSLEMHAQLGEMYVADERFTETYDQVAKGLAVFIRDAIRANLETS